MSSKKIQLCTVILLLLSSGTRSQDGDEDDDVYEEVEEETENCICVPFYQCENGEMDPTNLNDKMFELKGGPCGPYHVCCRLPNTERYVRDLDEDSIALPIPKNLPGEGNGDVCGVRNAHETLDPRRNLVSTDKADFGEYPWQVALLKKKDVGEPQLLCGGVLLSRKWVATAASCLTRLSPSEIILRLGEWDFRREDKRYPSLDVGVESIITHPEYSSTTFHNDIALIRIPQFVASQYPHISPACLPDQSQTFFGKRCWVTGWGQDSFGGKIQKVLKEVNVPIWQNDVCEVKFKEILDNQFKLYSGSLCAGGEAGKDSCIGDGGSPLVCEKNNKWFVVGLVSWGVSCGQTGVPSVYTAIDQYLDWIKNIID